MNKKATCRIYITAWTHPLTPTQARQESEAKAAKKKATADKLEAVQEEKARLMKELELQATDQVTSDALAKERAEINALKAKLEEKKQQIISPKPRRHCPINQWIVHSPH